MTTILKNNRCFLSGGGGTDDSKLLDQEFLKSFNGSRLLYIPVAMPGDKLTYESCYDWITATISTISDRFIAVEMCTDLKLIDGEILKSYDAIYVGGGNTYKLLQDICNSGFNSLLLDFISNGGKYYGGSAGAVIAGKDIDTVIEENDDNYRYHDGLNLLNNYAVICHYNSSLDNKIYNFIGHSHLPVVAMPENSGIIADGEGFTVCGFDDCRVFVGDGVKIIKAGERFEFKISSND